MTKKSILDKYLSCRYFIAKCHFPIHLLKELTCTCFFHGTILLKYLEYFQNTSCPKMSNVIKLLLPIACLIVENTIFFFNLSFIFFAVQTIENIFLSSRSLDRERVDLLSVRTIDIVIVSHFGFMASAGRYFCRSTY